jgi:hypothetical protein
MYGLLIGLTGLILGTFAGIVIGARYLRAEHLQAQIDETQARMLNLMNEMRSTLEETRSHAPKAWASAAGRVAGAGGQAAPATTDTAEVPVRAVPGAAAAAPAGDEGEAGASERLIPSV